MPTERERRKQLASWNADGRPSPFSHFSLKGLFWFAMVVMGIVPLICGGGHLH